MNANDKTAPMSVDELLQQQSKQGSLATIEPVAGSADRVKITPWTAAHGCNCHLAIEVPKASIQHVTPTGEKHHCCGKVLSVVEVTFNDKTHQSLSDVFSQMSARASQAGESAQGHASPPEQSFQEAGWMAGGMGHAPAGSLASRGNPRASCFAQCDRAFDLCSFSGRSDCDCRHNNCLRRCIGAPQQICLNEF